MFCLILMFLMWWKSLKYLDAMNKLCHVIILPNIGLFTFTEYFVYFSLFLLTLFTFFVYFYWVCLLLLSLFTFTEKCKQSADYWVNVKNQLITKFVYIFYLLFSITSGLFSDKLKFIFWIFLQNFDRLVQQFEFPWIW